jgi:AraC-like DNA-binding protein
MQPDPSRTRGLYLFRPPYTRCEPVDPNWTSEPFTPGTALVWFMAPVGDIYPELQRVSDRPHWLPLFIVLPEPEDILPIAGILRVVPDLNPRGVLPSAGRGFTAALHALLAAPPSTLPTAVGDQLEAAGFIDREDRARVEPIFAAAPSVSSIERLASTMCQSRRTLGRFFQTRGLPVPSHWLQFARILHVAIQIQNTHTNLNRVSARFGYTDGFTMSNSMKRLTGYRPSFVREHLGWEWLLAAWIRKERG